jgi:transposase
MIVHHQTHLFQFIWGGQYDALLAAGWDAHNLLKEIEPGYKKLRAMLKRLHKHKDCYLLFIKDYEVPFTNNLSERDLRPCKTKQKVSGCFRSWKGISNYTKIRSFISTLKKRGMNIFDSIQKVLKGAPVLRFIP